MKVFERISDTVRDHPWALIAVALLVTVVLGAGLFFLKGQFSYDGLLPEGVPSVETLESLKNKFGGISYEYVLIESESVTQPELVEFFIQLGEKIKSDQRFNQGQIPLIQTGEDEEVPFVQSYLTPFIANIRKEMSARGFDVPISSVTNRNIMMFTGMDLQELVETEYLPLPEVQDQMMGKFITEEGDYALVIIKYSPDLTQAEQVELADDLDDFFEEELSDVPGTEYLIAGDATLTRDFNHHIVDKTIMLFLIAIAVVLAALFLAFRRFTDTILPIGVMIIGLVCTFGFAGWVDIRFSVASIAIMPILLGTALTFVVPFVARYYEEMESEFRSVRAVGVALITIGVGVFLAAITNVFGFLVFEFSPLPPLKEFGLICAVGTIFIFLFSVSLLPAIMVLRDRRYEKPGREMRERRETHFDGLSRRKKRGLFTRATDAVLGSFSALSIKHSTLVIIVFGLLILAGFIQIGGLKTDSDLRTLVPKGLPGIHADYAIEETFGGFQQDIIMVEGDVLDPASLEAMKDLEEAIVSDPDNTYEGAALYPEFRMTGLPEVLAAANGGVLPQTEQEALQAVETAEANGGFVEGSLLSNDHRAALITLNAMGAETPEVLDRKLEILDSNCEEYLEKAGLTYRLGGLSPLTKDMTKNIIPTQTFSSILSLCLCAVILVIIFRSLPYGLITLTVALAGVAAEIGFLTLMNWPLDFVTSLVSALVIGIGINFGVLFTHRYMQEREVGENLPFESVDKTMMNLGRANVIAALATVTAFIIIMFSDIVPLKRFGGVTAFAIGWCLITSLTLLPALLCRFSGRLEAEEGLELEELEPEPEGT